MQHLAWNLICTVCDTFYGILYDTSCDTSYVASDGTAYNTMYITLYGALCNVLHGTTRASSMVPHSMVPHTELRHPINMYYIGVSLFVNISLVAYILCVLFHQLISMTIPTVV